MEEAGPGDNLTSVQTEAEAESVAITSIIVVTSVFTLFTTILVAVVIYQKWEEKMKQRRDGLRFGLLKPHNKINVQHEHTVKVNYYGLSSFCANKKCRLNTLGRR